MSELQCIATPARAPSRNIILTSSVDPTGIANARGYHVARLALIGGVATTFCWNWQNPETTTIMVFQVFVRVTTAGGAAATLEAGTAAGTGTNSVNMIAATALDTAPAPFNIDSMSDQAGTGRVSQLMDENGGATDWLNGQIVGGATSAGLVGYAYIFYIPLSQT